VPPDATPRIAAMRIDMFIYLDKILAMAKRRDEWVSPIGRTTTEVAEERARESVEYREARAEYAAIRELRERNWIAAHIRERRYELDLTQKEVAEKAGTSHSFISKVEKGDHMPTIVVLKRILSVLDEELLIGIESRDAEGEREVAPVPEIAA
jgi:DNA-binding XRE family transcriptional regulator